MSDGYWQFTFDYHLLVSLVNITTLLSDGVEFIEKQHAWRGSRVVKDPLETRCGLAKVARTPGLSTCQILGTFERTGQLGANRAGPYIDWGKGL
jgi:hypothetical protein